MELKDYIKSLERGGAKEFAKKIDVSTSFLSQMINGYSKIPIKRAKLIEKATEGKVKKETLRPDIWME